MLSTKEKSLFGAVIPSMDNVTSNDVRSLIALAPEFEDKVEHYFTTHHIVSPTVGDYMGIDINNFAGIVGILQAVILESEHIRTIVLEEADRNSYLLCSVCKPKSFTPIKVQEIFSKYLSVLTGDVPDFLYYSV